MKTEFEQERPWSLADILAKREMYNDDQKFCEMMAGTLSEQTIVHILTSDKKFREEIRQYFIKFLMKRLEEKKHG